MFKANIEHMKREFVEQQQAVAMKHASQTESLRNSEHEAQRQLHNANSQIEILRAQLTAARKEADDSGVLPWLPQSRDNNDEGELAKMERERDRYASRCEQAKYDRNKALEAKERVVVEAKKLQEYTNKLEFELHKLKPPSSPGQINKSSLHNVFSDVEYLPTKFVSRSPSDLNR